MNKNSDITETQYKNIMEANIKLMDKYKWIKQDIEKLMYKLKDYDDDLIHEILDDLEKIIKNNN